MSKKRMDRKQHILEVLAHELETSPGNRITTARLAEAVGVSEAALYRHFPSKARMFEGLIEFAESTLFSRINQILEQEKSTAVRCRQIVQLFCVFADRNPGIITVLSGDALASEDARLKLRVAQLFDRLQLQLKQVLRESGIRQDVQLVATPESLALLLLIHIQGMLYHFQQTDFKISLTDSGQEITDLLLVSFFVN
jgi:TetR/AcrR family transcriptional regulator